MSLDAADRSLERLLVERVPLPADAVTFDAPTRDWADARAHDTVNLFLYDIRENHDLRTRLWTDMAVPNGGTVRRPPPARVDLCYLVTAWSAASPPDVLDEHRLLGAVLRTLLRFRTLPPDVLQGELAEQRPLPPLLVAQPNGPQEPAEIWSALTNLPHAFLHLVVTIAVPPSAYPDTSRPTPPVSARVLRTGVGTGPAARLGLRPRLGGPHPAGEPVARAEIGPGILARLAAPVFASNTSVTVADGRNVRAGARLFVDGGDASDLLPVSRRLPPGRAVLPAEPPLRFPHDRGAAVRGVTVVPVPRGVLFAGADAGGTSLRFAATGLADGAWLLISDGERTEPVRLAAENPATPETRPIRRALRFPHEQGVGLHEMTVGSVVTTLADPAAQPTTAITLDGRGPLDSGALAENMTILLGTGAVEAEPLRLGPVPPAPGVTVPMTTSVAGDHPVGATIRHVTGAEPAGRLHLPGGPGESAVVIAAAAGFRPGDVIRLGAEDAGSHHVVTEVSTVPGAVAEGAGATALIGGLVTDAGDPALPLEGASVLLVELRRTTTTDTGGRFTFAGLTPGPTALTLRVRATGYSGQDRLIRVPPDGDGDYHVRLNTG
ncbi:Pvc16 family protein [Streptomyces sp. UC4497]